MSTEERMAHKIAKQVLKENKNHNLIAKSTENHIWLRHVLDSAQLVKFIDFNSNYVVQFFILIITYVVLDFLSLIGYAILAQKLIIWIKANPNTINTISASVLVLIASIIIISQQY